MRGANLFHKILSKQGIRHVFGIMGREAEMLPLDPSGSIRWILVRHEFTGAIAAEAYARLSGRPQVAFSTFGPGATNMATGVASALLDRSPLLAISAQVERPRRLFGQTHQCIDQVSLMRPITKYAAELEDACELASKIHAALTTACTEPFGPAFLSIPVDLFQQEIPETRAHHLLRGFEPVVGNPSIEPKQDALDAAYSFLAKSRHPIAVVGNEVIRDKASAQLTAFCEKFGVPAVQTLASKGSISEGHALNIGPVNRYLDGLLGLNALSRIFDPADLILLIGHDLAEDIDPQMWGGAGNKRVVRLGLTNNLSQRIVKSDAEVVGSLQKSLSLLASSAYPRPKRTTNGKVIATLRLARERVRWDDERKPSAVDPCRIIRDIRDALGPDGILVADVGIHKHLAGLLSATHKPNTFLCSNGLGTFGFGLPAAVGAQLACPDRKIVAVVGDGGFHSGSQDLETLARCRLPVVIVVFSDSAFGLIKHYQSRGKQQAHGDAVNFQRVDFAMLAQANGCRGVLVASAAEFSKALKEALTGPEPTLIEVPVNYRYSAYAETCMTARTARTRGAAAERFPAAPCGINR